MYEKDMMAVLTSKSWMVGNGDDKSAFAVQGYATSFGDMEYLILKSTDKVLGLSYNWYITEFKLTSKGQLFVTGIPYIVTAQSIQLAVQRFNLCSIGVPDFFHMEPIQMVATPQSPYSMEFTENGDWDKKMFSGTFDELEFIMSKLGWSIPLGTSLLDTRKVSIIAWTDLEKAICLLSNESSFGFPVLLTPVNVYNDGTFAGNYGIVVAGNDLSSAINNFNNSVGENSGKIVEILTCEGKRMTFDV